MVKDSVKLISPKLLDQAFNIINNATDNNPAKKAQYKKWSAYIRGKAPEEFKQIKIKGHFLRVRNIPDDARENEVANFFHGFRLNNESICFLYSNEGFFTGEAHIKMITEQDWKEAFQLSMSQFIPGKFVEILDSTEQDWKRAYNSQFPEKKEDTITPDVVIDRGILKLNNVPLTFIETDISGIFSGFK